MNSDPIEDSPVRHNPVPPRAAPKIYDSGDDSGDDLFDGYGTNRPGDTVATASPHNQFAHQSRARNDGHSQFITQPTQPLKVTPKAEKLSEILVPASSPTPDTATLASPNPAPARSQPQPQPFPQFYNPMAPPGTIFRPPGIQAPNTQSQEQTQFSDFGDPQIEISDEEDELLKSRRIGEIKATYPRKSSSKTPGGNFKDLTSQYAYRGTSSGSNGSITPQKRPADDMISAYGNVSRPPKQPRPLAPTTPKVAGATQPKAIQQISDIKDFATRRLAQEIMEVTKDYPIERIVDALKLKRLNKADALEHIYSQMAIMQKREAIDLTKDDDAEGDTDEEVATAKPTANRNLQAQKASLAAYSRLAQKRREPSSSRGEPPSSSQPERTPPRKPLSRLKAGIRGDRSRSSSVAPARKLARRVIEDDDEEDAVDADGHYPEIESEIPVVARQSVDDKVFAFLASCTERELIAMIDCKAEDAEFLLSKRPFKSLARIREINRPLAMGKRRGGNQRVLGDRLTDQLISVEESLQAVDRIVDRCQQYLKDVQREMKSLGIDIGKATKEDGLNVASFQDIDAESQKVDSGTGTPAPSVNPRIEQPKSMSSDRTLKDYQLVGLNWLATMFALRKKWDRASGCILADEMGLGKTYQVISFITYLYEKEQRLGGKGEKHLVVVPSSTLENWLREFANFSPELHVEPYYGKASQRTEQQYAIEQAQDSVKVIVTTYNIASADKDNKWLRTMKFSSCVFDEGHKLKNANSKGYKSLRRMRANFRLFLTGTPLQNNLTELISVLAFIMPNLFEEYEEDLQMIFDCKAKTTDTDHGALLASQRTSRAKDMLKPFILRRTKDQVLKDLPPKTNKLVMCDMTCRQKEVYDYFSEIHDDMLKRRQAGEKIEESGKFPHLQDRRSAAIHPLLRRWIYGDEDIEQRIVPKVPRKGKPWLGKSDIAVFQEMTWFSDFQIHETLVKYGIKKPPPLKQKDWMDSGKVEKLIELLDEHKKTGSRTLIFSQYAKVLDILYKVLETKGISNLRLDGTTPTEDRLKLIDLFNDDPTIQTFMITTRSGGAGINLASADRVIIFDPSFNPQDDVQAANRAHRIGQTKPVEVITLVSKGTIEEQIYKLGQAKLALDARVAGVDDDPETGGDKIDMANMKRIEEMLVKGQTTPSDAMTPRVGTPKPEGEGDKNRQAKRFGKQEKDDVKKEFKSAMEASGVEFAAA